jgi:hypothetical protein
LDEPKSVLSLITSSWVIPPSILILGLVGFFAVRRWRRA